jgi:hypothetical protein
MIRNNNDDMKIVLPPQHNIRDYIIALLLTVIPFITLLIVMAIRSGNGGNLIWLVTLFLWVVALIVNAAFAISGKRRWITFGILTGIIIGLGCIVLSCSALLP